MKKFLLVCLGLAMCTGLSAQKFTRLEKSQITSVAVNEDIPLRASTDNGYDLQFCGGLETCTSYTAGSSEAFTYYNSIYITPDVASALAGNQLTQLTFATAFTGTVDSHQGSIYVAEERYAEPITSTECTIPNCYDSNSQTFTPATISFAEPYTIKEGVGFYVGYTVEDAGDKDYPVGIGKSIVNPFAGYVDVYSDGEYAGSVDMAQTGDNLYLIATTVGETKELLNVAILENIEIGKNSGDYTFASVTPGSQLEFYATVYNCSDKVINAMEFDVVNGEGEPVVVSSTDKVYSKAKKTNIKIPVTVKEGQNGVELRLAQVGDKKMLSAKTVSTSYFGVADDAEGYPRNIVVEEGTGTWCGWCPLGIVGMDYMEETYTNDFVGIAVHASDKFEVDTYMPFVNKFFSGFPSGVVNRDPKYIIDPSVLALEKNYNQWKQQRTFAKVELKADKLMDESAIIAKVETTFKFDATDANYRLAFVVLEEGLKGVQTNYYAGGKYGEMDGWEDKGSSVAWTYTNTARDIFKVYGIENSIPTTVAAETPNTFTYEVPLDNVSDINQTKIVAMLIEGYTGVVLNAAMVKAADYGISGISSAVAEQACNVRGLKGEIAIEGNYSAARAYNLAGQQVGLTGLAAGIYVVNVDGHSYKVAVK